MATEVVRDMADTIIGNKDTMELESNPSAATVIIVDNMPLNALEKFTTEDTSGYTLTCESGFSRDVERWMKGDISQTFPVGSAPSGDRASSIQPQPQPLTPSMYCGLWYLAATVALPFVNLSNSLPPEWISWYRENEAAGKVWVESMSTKLHVDYLLTKMEEAFTQASCLCSRVQCQVRRLAQEQALRDVFAAAMDVVLVAYAVGFLLLSLCQASVIGF